MIDAPPMIDGTCGSIDGRDLRPAGSTAEGRCGSIDGRDLRPAGSTAEGRCGSIDGRDLRPAGSTAEGRCGSIEPTIATLAGRAGHVIADLLVAGAGYLYEIVSKIISSISTIAPLAVVLGCQGPTVTPTPEVDHGPAVSIAQPSPTIDEPKPLGQFTITFYYVIGEEEILAKKPANDNDEELTAIGPVDHVSLYEAGTCKEIAEVSSEFASQLAIQGTGKLRDGRVLNIWGRCTCDRTPCFKVTENQWGTAGSNHPLQPFRTVAVDPKVVKLGTLLYVPLLEGRTMPGRAPWGGYVHDGCVVADDTGGHINGNRLDLFVGRKAYFLGLSNTGSSHAWARHVPVYDGSQICERKGRQVGRKTGAI